MTRPLLVATRNAGKLHELRTLLAGAGVELRSLDAYPNAPRVEEVSDTYLANAAAKALTLARYAQLPALADDSGLEVDALHGAPGVRSARFAGAQASDAQNIALLLDRLAGVGASARSARFRAVIVVAQPDGSGVFAEGMCEGLISDTPRGKGGFGYDPVFFCPPLNRTFAEVDPDDKNRISHRAAACARIIPLLPRLL